MAKIKKIVLAFAPDVVLFLFVALFVSLVASVPEDIVIGVILIGSPIVFTIAALYAFYKFIFDKNEQSL